MPKNQNQNRSSLSASTLKWSLPFLAVFLPIVLLSVYSFRIASDSVRDLVEAQNISAAGNLSQLLISDMTKNVVLADAFASIPGTVQAVQMRDEVSLRTRLKAIVVSNPEIARAYVADTSGKIWNEFPTASGSYGAQISTAWLQQIEAESKPFVTSAYPSSITNEPVTGIVVPIAGTGATLEGVLVFEYSTRSISASLKNTELGQGGLLYLLDSNGTLVAHPEDDLAVSLSSAYQNIPSVRSAMAGILQTTEYVDPLTETLMLATFIPVKVSEGTWIVVAEQPKAAAFEVLDHVKFNISIAGAVLTFFTLGMVIALARTSSKNIKLNRELEQKNRALDEFASIVSHQLKAPITALRWTLESILDGDLGPLSDAIRKELESMSTVNIGNYHLIMDILNISRLERGVVAMDLKKVSLKELADAAMRDYLPAAEKAGIYLKVEGDGSVLVNADTEKSSQAIGNSISNAMKHTHQGGITVRLSTDAMHAVIDVTDTGEGMTPETISQLFSRDGIKRANASAESSSGLGLYIAKKFMEMQSGDIMVTSELGKGSTFRYTWPLTKEIQ